ncbi:MAG: lytic transglycosylase domain-containing protein [Endomicrobiales bacterium]|nr:lytic transglycosylase domain-containing protein [Endomicrobiales bacterium]
MIYSVLLLILLFGTLPISAEQGKVILKNGNVFEGSIENLSDGSCWVEIDYGFVKFDKNEIEDVILYSKKKTSKNKPVNLKKLNAAQENSFYSYDDYINHAATKNNIDPALIKAVIKTESDFNHKTTSNKGACGLMQLMPETAEDLGVKNIYAPKENIDGGVKYLKEMLVVFNGDIEKALAAYNAGPKAVEKYQGVPPYRETKLYIDKVYKYYLRYKYPNRTYSFIDESGCLYIYNVK